jgi:hypothetical protein
MNGRMQRSKKLPRLSQTDSVLNLSAMLAFSMSMPDLVTYLDFIAAVLFMQVTPGPDMALVIGRGVGQGRRVAFCTVLGFIAAGLIQVPLLVLGVASHRWLSNSCAGAEPSI